MSESVLIKALWEQEDFSHGLTTYAEPFEDPNLQVYAVLSDSKGDYVALFCDGSKFWSSRRDSLRIGWKNGDDRRVCARFKVFSPPKDIDMGTREDNQPDDARIPEIVKSAL